MSRTNDDIQDELLVLKCRDGDAEALRALIARWHPRLAGLAWRLTCEREAVKDIVQDSWLAIIRGLGRLDDPARFRTWAYRIVRNKCVDWTRRRVVQRKIEDDLVQATAQAAGPRGNRDSDSDVDRIRDALAQLPGEQRAIVSLFYLDGASVSEIAHALGIPAGTVKSRLFHARDRLRRAFERTTQ
jgi:RNA polymerase sigma factor (sigma-70 family)